MKLASLAMQEIHKRILILHMYQMFGYYLGKIQLLTRFQYWILPKNVTKQLKNKQNSKIFLITPNTKYCFLHSQ